jgi:endo-1,4-beta-mannosidase
MKTLSADIHPPLPLLRHRFGVNYVPSRNWYYCYNDWESDSICRDLDAVAALGADHVRVMMIWPWFQPNPTALSESHLDHLEQILAIASDRDLDVLVTLYTGWLSGYHFNPPFLENEPFYTSPEWAKVQDLLLDGVAKRMQKHKNFMGFDLGNEINCNWQAPLADGDAWMQRIFTRMQTLCPQGVHVNGVDHAPWFTENTFSPQALVAQQAIVPVHCWPFWSQAGKYGQPLDDPYTRLTAGMASLVRSFGQAPQKPIWIEEFGVCSEEMPEADIPRWLEKAVTSALEQGVSWFTWWASHDVDRRFQFHPFEYGLGLLTTDNRPKKQGQVFKQIATAYRGKPVSLPSTPLPPPPAERNEQNTWRWLLDWMSKNG